MKRYIKFIIASIIVIMICAAWHVAANRTQTNKQLVSDSGPGLKTYLDLGGSTNDTLIYNDTATYIFKITHNVGVWPYLHVKLHKTVISGYPTTGASVVMTMFQSNNGIDYLPITRYATGASFTKTMVGPSTGLGVDTVYAVDFLRDTLLFNGIYLKIVYRQTVNHAKVTVRSLLKINNK